MWLGTLFSNPTRLNTEVQFTLSASLPLALKTALLLITLLQMPEESLEQLRLHPTILLIAP